ncbi:MAG: signal peptidase I, partial [Cellulomonadaceae bacterium]|nr:signal peptidase I [Cellulomonadaceae bacterium]
CTTLTIVSGHSMEPVYYTGDLVVSRCGPVEVGDVIVYSPPDVGGARVIHRIIGGDAESGWVMQGDNNDFIDPWNPSGDQVLGRNILHLPHVGSFTAILLSPLTWASVLLVALAIVVWPGKDESGKDEAGSDERSPDETGPGAAATDGSTTDRDLADASLGAPGDRVHGR